MDSLNGRLIITLFLQVGVVLMWWCTVAVSLVIAVVCSRRRANGVAAWLMLVSFGGTALLTTFQSAFWELIRRGVIEYHSWNLWAHRGLMLLDALFLLLLVCALALFRVPAWTNSGRQEVRHG